MLAVILAAGGPKGSGLKNRLSFPLFFNKPKCLYKVNQKTQLAHVIDDLRIAGASKIRIVAGYKHKQIEKFITEHYQNCEIVINDDFSGPAINSYRCGLNNITEDALICFADEKIKIKYLKEMIETTGDIVVLKSEKAQFPADNLFKVSVEKSKLFFDSRFEKNNYYNDLFKYLIVRENQDPDLSSGYSLGLIFHSIYLRVYNSEPESITTINFSESDYQKDIDSFEMTDDYKVNPVRFFSVLFWLNKFKLTRILKLTDT